MSTFDRNFRELLAMDAARRAPKSAGAPASAPVELDDETIAADDMREIDEQLMRARGRYRRGANPAQLTQKHIELARRFAAGEEPSEARRRPPLNYKLRAIRSLLATPLFVSTYEALRSERSPSIEQLRAAVRPFNSEAEPRVPISTQRAERPFAGTPGYVIKLRDL